LDHPAVPLTYPKRVGADSQLTQRPSLHQVLASKEGIDIELSDEEEGEGAEGLLETAVLLQGAEEAEDEEDESLSVEDEEDESLSVEDEEVSVGEAVGGAAGGIGGNEDVEFS
jgi:hypothetical protein